MATLVLPLWALPGWLPGLLNIFLLLAGIILIVLVLIQRGKGGGLAGAFGGTGGSSAFGSRAGDFFTMVTIYTALAWVVLVMFTIKVAMADAFSRAPAPRPDAISPMPTGDE